MNTPFKRDLADSLLPQLEATNAMYRTAYKLGFDDGHLAGLKEARELVEKAFAEWPQSQAT